MSHAHYLSVIWSPNGLRFPHADLWIERLGEWIAIRNDTSRCVGFPLAGDYVTFQQVCTWITGFPGRLTAKGDSFRYEPLRKHLSMSGPEVHNSISVRIDESTVESLHGPSSNHSTILVAPSLRGIARVPQVFIPCAIPGVDHEATFFRTDGTVAVEAMDSKLISRPDRVLSIAEILSRLGELQ
jgi:formylmethanofuran dehydrogenase subunit B